jgi:AraC-like DNA-binding protein
MNPKVRQPTASEEPVVNGAPSSWRSKFFATRDVDELIFFINTETPHKAFKLVPLQKGSSFSFARAAIDLGRLTLIQSRNTSFHLEAHPTLLTLIVSETGRSLIKYRDVEIHSHCGDSALVGRPDHVTVFQSFDATRFVIHIDERHILDQLAAGDSPIDGAIPAPFRLDLSTPVATSFHRAVDFIWNQRAPRTELLRAAYDEILLQGLVSLFAPILDRDASARIPDPGPAYLKRACEVIRSSAAEPVRIAEIATRLGISPRHLQAGFRNHLGTTPQRFLRDCRLDLANRRLAIARPGETTTAIAYDCGFGHLGEFAQVYRRRFGESPSETLRRSK